MGLTKRQAQAIEQIIIEESRSASASQHERHRILDEIDGDRPTDTWVPGLTEPVRLAIVDLVEAFHRGNMVYEGVEFDGGQARARALQYLRRLVENDALEVQRMLQEGDFDDLDQGGYGMDQIEDDEVDLPPMHPRGREERVSMKPGQVKVGAPSGMKATLPEPEHGGGYQGDSDDDVELPPMHPRGRG